MQHLGNAATVLHFATYLTIGTADTTATTISMQDKAAKYRRLRGKFLYVAATADSSASASETVRNKVAKDSFVALQGVNSLYEVFQRSVAQWPDNKCLGRRVADVWVWETYKVSSAQRRVMR